MALHQRSLLSRFLGYFVAGVLAVLPVVITFAVVAWVTDYIARFVGPGSLVGNGLQSFGLQVVNNDTLAYVVGWVLVLSIVFALGLFVELGAKRMLQSIVDALLTRVPIVSSIYGTSKQLIGMLDKKDEADLQGMRSVFCLFGDKNPTAMLALLTSPERFNIGGQEYHAVIIPTAPVPIGGGLVFVPAEKVISADVSVDGLMSVYVSMGVTAPQFLPVAERS
ncbi:MAG: DUF502 domain-containing protein [Pirellulaceae bacterium]|nr:DUF502 domain-containing protein [Pirellulaceae bacterium]